MTSWIPVLEDDGGPRYLQLARQIEKDIEGGKLVPGDKLPPQRNLAFDIGVTVGTVGRAYQIARERGLVSGEIGRGTFVSAGRSNPPLNAHAGWFEQLAPPNANAPTDGLIRFDSSSAKSAIASAPILEAISESVAAHPIAVTDYVREIAPEWQEAGARWIEAGCDWKPDASCVVPVHGAHSGIMAILSTMSNPGDRIVCETLTYATLARSVQMIGRQITPVAMDEHGILPEALETICAQKHPKLLFLMPALHNPLATSLPLERRREIVRIARAYNVMIIEDNLYGSVSYDPHPPMAALAPDITFHIAGLSKAVAAGMRSAWVACPQGYQARVLSAHKLTCGGTSFVLTDASARLVNSGAAFKIKADWDAEIEARSNLVRNCLRGYEVSTNRKAPYIWLKLPEPWLSGMFKNAALQSNVRIDDEDEFKAGRGEARAHGVRIAFSIPQSRATVERGAQIIAQLLASGTAAYHSFA